MEQVLMLVMVIKVGLFGFTTTDKDYILFSSMEQCKNHLEIKHHSYNKFPQQRNDYNLKVTDEANHTIYIWSCRAA